MDDYLAAVRRQLSGIHAELPETVSRVAGGLLLSPGKLLRSRLMWHSSAFGPRPALDLLCQFAGIVETLHIATLLHDDVIDKADERRGLPAAHTEFGRERAVLAGMFLIGDVSYRASLLGENVAREVADAVVRLARGELMDVERAFDLTVSRTDYLAMARHKTGALFGLACVLGALSSGCEIAAVPALRQFGVDFGAAFQILDDCLDYRSDKSGKPAGTDHLLGLCGYPTILALETDFSDEVKSIILGDGFSSADLPALGTAVTASGAIDRAHKDASRLLEAAISDLPPAADSGDGGSFGDHARQLLGA